MSGFFGMEDGAMAALRLGVLEGEAMRWIGTPFVARSMIRGAGVDCIHLAAALYLRTGALKDFKPPRYSLDGGHHNQESQVLAWLKNNPDFIQVFARNLDGKNTVALRPGDLLCFTFGKSEHHVGVLLRGWRFIHARHRRQVEITSMGDPIYKRCLTTAFRIRKVAE